MDKIYQCGIYGKGYKPQDMTTMFYYGMNLDSVYNYMGITQLFDEEDLIKEVEIEVSNIDYNDDSVEIKKVKGFKILGKFGIEKNIIAIPYRIYEVKKVNYVNPFSK